MFKLFLGIQKHLISKGLEEVNVSFSTGEVCYSSSVYKESEVKNIIKKLGYRITENNKKKNIPYKKGYFYLH